MRPFLLLLLLCLIVSEARADILIGQWSKHERPKDYYNETHELVGIEAKGWHASTFVNSDGDRSYLAGGAYSRTITENIKLRGICGVAHGYEKSFFVPAIILGFTLSDRRLPVQLDINYVPLTLWSAGFRIPFD